MGRKLRNMSFLGHFGLGQPVALREIPGSDQKQEKTQLPGARGTFRQFIKLLGHLGGACASSKQAAASSKQATRPSGPLAGHRAIGVPKRGKKCYHAIRDGVGTTNHQSWGRKARVSATEVLHASEWPCPGGGPRVGPHAGPKTAQKSPKTGPGASVGGGPRRLRRPT